MPKTKNKPGIHLHITELTIMDIAKGVKPEYYWVIISGKKIIARSWRMYTRKADAIRSIKATDQMFAINGDYYDHSKPDSPLRNYML